MIHKFRSGGGDKTFCLLCVLLVLCAYEMNYEPNRNVLLSQSSEFHRIKKCLVLIWDCSDRARDCAPTFININNLISVEGLGIRTNIV